MKSRSPIFAHERGLFSVSRASILPIFTFVGVAFRLTNVVDQDLTYFTNLAAADYGENELSLESFYGFPSIEELHLYCNNVRRVPRNISVSEAYEKLRVLNLSYVVFERGVREYLFF